MADETKFHATDDIVARFTHEILGLANKKGIDFAYVSPKPTSREEILKVMSVNMRVVKHLLRKK